MVICSLSGLRDLLADLDELAWPGNDAHSARIFFERSETGSTIVGGMGGGFRREDVWLHQLFVEQQLEAAIRAVISGDRERLR